MQKSSPGLRHSITHRFASEIHSRINKDQIDMQSLRVNIGVTQKADFDQTVYKRPTAPSTAQSENRIDFSTEDASGKDQTDAMANR